MNLNQPSPQQNNLNIVYWAMAAEPVILAAIAIFLKASNAVNISLSPASEEILLVVFLALSTAFVWLSFRFASGRNLLPEALTARANLQGFRLVALGLAIAPGILGFIHYMFFGKLLALLLLNGGAMALAIKYITQFNEGSSPLPLS